MPRIGAHTVDVARPHILAIGNIAVKNLAARDHGRRSYPTWGTSLKVRHKVTLAPARRHSTPHNLGALPSQIPLIEATEKRTLSCT